MFEAIKSFFAFLFGTTPAVAAAAVRQDRQNRVGPVRNNVLRRSARINAAPYRRRTNSRNNLVPLVNTRINNEDK